MCRPSQQLDPIQQLEKAIPDAFRSRSRFTRAQISRGEQPREGHNRYFYMQLMFQTRLYTPFTPAQTGTGYIIMRLRFGLHISPRRYLEEVRQVFTEFEQELENEHS